MNSEKQYRQLIETLQDGIWSIDQNGFTTFVNRRMAEMLGYSTEEMLGSHLFDFMDETQIKKAERNIERRKTGIKEQHDFELTRKDGTTLFVSMETSDLVNEKGEYIGALAGVMDISSRKAAQDALQAERDNLYTVLHASPVGMLVFSEDEKVIICNSTAEAIFNRTATEIRSLRCGDFIRCIHRRDCPEGCGKAERCPDCDLNQAIKRTLGNELDSGYLAGETMITIDSSSQPFWVEYRAGALMLDSRKCAILSIIDITSRKTAEEALRTSENRYRALFEKAAEGILIHDLQGNILDANQAAEAMFGYTLSELKQLHPSALVHPTESKFIADEFDIIIKEGISVVEHRCVRKDGSEIIVAVRGKLVEDNLIQGVLLDVTTERKQAEQLRMLTRAIEHTAESVVITNTNGDIQYVNPAFTEVTGYTAKEVLGKNPRILKSGRVGHRFYQNLWNTITQGNVWKGEFYNIDKSGKGFWEEATISPVFRDDGRISHYVAVKKDVTAQKRLEEHKADVERMMRHDLKSPLNGIIGIPDIILSDDNLTDEQRELLKLIETSGRHMLQMIDLSLDMYKIETGNYKHTPSAIDVVSVIQTLIKQNQAQLSANQLICVFELDRFPMPEGQSFVIPSDERLLTEVLSNLLKNAIEASPPGELIRFLFASGPPQSISVENKGVVPLNIREQFFDKYVTHGKSTGTGLGTYSAKLLASAMGYEIDMATSDEQGITRVSIHLPEEAPSNQ